MKFEITAFTLFGTCHIQTAYNPSAPWELWFDPKWVTGIVMKLIITDYYQIPQSTLAFKLWATAREWTMETFSVSLCTKYIWPNPSFPTISSAAIAVCDVRLDRICSSVL